MPIILPSKSANNQGFIIKEQPGYIYIAATLDTKSIETFYVSQLIKQNGLAVRIVDLSTQSDNLNDKADITAEIVASYHPIGRKTIFDEDKGKAIAAMAIAFEKYLSQQKDVLAVLGLGGSGGTALITPAMQSLAIGIPKLMVSTMASGDVSGYIGASDIAMMYSVIDISGLNMISRKILKNAAAQIAGAVLFNSVDENEDNNKPILALTMFGVTTPCVQQLTKKLDDHYDCLVFHATGGGGKAMEKLIDSQLLDCVLDITTTEVCDHLLTVSLPVMKIALAQS